VRAGPDAGGGRRPLAAANWKMHFVRAEAEAFCGALTAGWSGAGGDAAPEVVVFPSFPLLRTVADALAGSPIGLGAQDLHAEARGAYTGDVSALQLVDAGCTWVLCGHSERRRHHGESDAAVGAKASAALAAGLAPVVCVGETREERRSGRTFDVLARQLEALPADPRLVLAYEPVWAIGSGDTATPETAADAHAFLRERVARRSGAAAANCLRILYGGSVDEDNAPELAAQPEIDGFLVGGASLDPTRFLAILGALAARSGGVRGSP
jgi:triosephosphate isomerase (TIM)